MGRPPRLCERGAIFHLTSRGNGGQAIFLDNRDFEKFLAVLVEAKRRMLCRVFAYCLMTNHFHLVLRLDRCSVSTTMQYLLTRYASWFNFRRRRTGHLFQGRFKSMLCARDAYLLELLRYVHLNPVRAGLVSRPELWPWSGHRELLGLTHGEIADAAFPLSLFDRAGDSARDAYRRFIDEGMAGGTSFEPVFGPAGSAGIELPEGQRSEPEPSPSLAELGREIEAETGISIRALSGPSRARRVTAARRDLVRRAIGEGCAPSAVAAFLNRSASAVSKAAAS